jgi:futalosine hydrolase
MKILLCAATEIEIAPTMKHLQSYKDGAIEALITGVGLMASTYALTKAATSYQPDLIIQAGIAGTLDANLELGKVVAVRQETVGDLGVQEGESFKSLFDLNLLGTEVYPWSKGVLSNSNKILSECDLSVVDGVTVNEISTKDETITYYRNVINAQVESMEGAALHYVGLMERIPFLQIRSLSNFTGERDKTKWAMQKAVTNLNDALQRILKKLTE